MSTQIVYWTDLSSGDKSFKKNILDLVKEHKTIIINGLEPSQRHKVYSNLGHPLIFEKIKCSAGGTDIKVTTKTARAKEEDSKSEYSEDDSEDDPDYVESQSESDSELSESSGENMKFEKEIVEVINNQAQIVDNSRLQIEKLTKNMDAVLKYNRNTSNHIHYVYY